MKESFVILLRALRNNGIFPHLTNELKQSITCEWFFPHAYLLVELYDDGDIVFLSKIDGKTQVLRQAVARELPEIIASSDREREVQLMGMYICEPCWLRHRIPANEKWNWSSVACCEICGYVNDDWNFKVVHWAASLDRPYPDELSVQRNFVAEQLSYFASQLLD